MIFLLSLYFLHIYWFYLFIQIAVKLKNEGATDDMQAKVVKSTKPGKKITNQEATIKEPTETEISQVDDVTLKKTN